MIQTQFLNYILHTKDSSIITLNNLTNDYFSDYQAEYLYIKNHLNTYGNIPDLQTFCEHFKDFEVFEVTESPQYLLSELTKDKTKRLLVNTVNKMAQSINNKDVDAAVEILRKSMQENMSTVALNCTDLLHDTTRFERYIDRVENKDKYFIKTGFDELDELLGGWDRKEDLVTIVARNGVGKSWVLFKCASAAANAGLNVGIYSGEMSEDAVGYRIDTMLGHISNGALVHGGASIRNQYKNYLNELVENSSGHLWTLTPKDIGGFAKPSLLRAFVEKYNLDVLFVDQYSLMLDDEGSEIERIRLANISTGLKLLQSTKGIPVITVAQQNREKLEGDKAFDTTQIMGCDMIGQNSSVVLFLDRKEKDDLMLIYLGKLRQSGGTGKFLKYRVNLNTGDWQYIPEEESSEQHQMIDSNGQTYSGNEVF